MKKLCLFILGLLLTVVAGHAQYTNAGWYANGGRTDTPTLPDDSSPPQVSPLTAPYQDYLSLPSGSVAETVTPDIQALAGGLQNNPFKIYNYVHDHIRFVLYFGAEKGAELTLLEKSGNDFDQCALLSALLQAAGYHPAYQFGWMGVPYDSTDGTHNDLHHWFQLNFSNTNWSYTSNYLVQLVWGSRGYPTYYLKNTNQLLFQRVWVTVPVGGTNYFLDPAFKVSEPVAGLNVAQAMGFNSNSLLTAVGGTETNNGVSGINENTLRSTLAGYTANLLGYLQSNCPNASVAQVLGGWQIVPNTNHWLTTNLLFNPLTWQSMPVTNWTVIPTNLIAMLNIGYAGTNYSWFTPQLEGQRLTLAYDTNGVGSLWQDDSNLVQKATGAGDTNVTVHFHTPAGGGWNITNNTLIPGAFFDFTNTAVYQRTNATYALTYAFEPDWGWLQARENKLAAYRQQGLPDTSLAVTAETLNIMGLNWMLQTEYASRLMEAQQGILSQYYWRFGRMAQEAGHGYYIDVYLQDESFMSNNGWDNGVLGDVPNRQFILAGSFASALESGLIEQMQNTNLAGASAVKMLELAVTNGQAVYLANWGNWGSLNGTGVSQLITNYTSTQSAALDNMLRYQYPGYPYMLLPQNGSNHVTSAAHSWAGFGYELVTIGSSAEFDISGGYNGGHASDPAATVNPPYVEQNGEAQPPQTTQVAPNTPTATGADPVDLADGTFQVEHTDLTLGQAAPSGITLSRYYNGMRRYGNPAGMAGGWVHNYWVNATATPAPQAALGGTTPPQAAAMIAATAAAIGIFNDLAPDPKNWLVTDLIAQWGADQITSGGVSVNLGKDVVQFVRQPSGGFTPPAGSTLTLTQSGGNYVLQERHGNTFNFDALGRLSTIVDPYGNTQSLTYLSSTSSLPQTVTDWKNRVLTFNYTNGLLASVSDGSRSAGYGYGTAYNPQGDLTTFTDAEGKTTTYSYDTNHQITATVDALSQLVVSNVYDSLGHVATQYSQGAANRAWHIYWSRWQVTEQDPAGGVRVLTYDDGGRQTGLQDQLGQVSLAQYDGQNHLVESISPLNETNRLVYDGNNNLVQSVDPLGFTNQYVYDGNNNLIKTIDPRDNPTTFGYNAQFSLIGQTNGAGDWVNRAYNADGTLHTKTDMAGTTTYGYDSYGQVNSITYPGSLGSESFLNSALGDVTSHTNANGNTTTFTYNNRRELTNSTGPTNLTTSVVFDAIGNVAGTTDARGNVTSQTWSPTRQLLTTSYPAMAAGVPVVTNGYDNRDWLTRTADPLTNPLLYTNDLAGRLITETDPLSRTTRFVYDADGHKLSTANAANETNSQTWDARGSLIRLTDGAGHFSTRGYDAAGNQVVLTNRNGKPWQFQFDAANRLTFTISPLGRSNSVVFNHQGLPVLLTDQAGQSTTNTYDARARLTSRGDKVGLTTNLYDPNNNLLSVMENGASNVWTYDAYNRVSTYQDANGYAIQYRYDGNGNVTNIVYPGGKNVFYAYDNLNHLAGVEDWSGRITTLLYDLDGHLTSITRPNGSYRTIGYDAAGQVTNILEQMANGLPIAWSRLNWTNSGTMSWEFAAPQPHAVTVPTRTMMYDADNRLATFNGQSTVSDLDGNLTSAPLITTNFAAYAYDARNRLLNAGGVTNAYDPVNNRIGQTFGTNTTTYVVNPGAKLPQVLMRIKNGVTNYYIYGAGLLYQITETATGTNTLTYHYDYRGSTIALSSDSGLVTDRVEYSLYGLTTYRAGTNDTPFLFNGRYGVQTDLNGLLYMRSRYYNPYLCRFINPDPSGFKSGLNFYAYANGNPVTYLDPYGLNAAATGDSDNSSWYNQVPGQPCLVCHGVSANGFNGDINSFYGLPGSSANALTGYSDLVGLSINATPMAFSPLTGLATAVENTATEFTLADVQAAIASLEARGIQTTEVQSSIDPNQVISLAKAMQNGTFQNALMNSPVIIDSDVNAIIAGNHRVIAAEMANFDLTVNAIPGSATMTVPLSSVPLQAGRVNAPIINAH